jgi:SPP1 gp7 family putative phage head morphogenesis protein
MAIEQGFNLPMTGAREFWRDKVQLGPGAFSRLSDEAKIRAFAIGGIARGDELKTVFDALQRAIDNGESFDKFKKECREIFERRGWTGKRAWRVDNIYRTNIQTAYNVGHYEQLKEDRDILPYWQYSAVNDRRTRPTHLAMNGRVWPADHPIWNKWYPPNGYRCRCSVIGLTKSQIERRGLKIEADDPTDKPIMGISPKTGQEELMPRQLLPDPGFEHHPGKLVWGGLIDWSERGIYQAMDDLSGPADYRRQALANVRPAEIPELNEEELLPPGKDDLFYKEEFVKRYGQEQLRIDAVGEPVILSLRSFLVDKAEGAAERWKFAKSGHGEAIPLLAGMIERPFEIWLVPQQDKQTGRVRLVKRYISLWKAEDKERVGGLAVFEVVDGVYRGVTAFIPFKKGRADLDYAEKQRLGLLLYPKR